MILRVSGISSLVKSATMKIVNSFDESQHGAYSLHGDFIKSISSGPEKIFKTDQTGYFILMLKEEENNSELRTAITIRSEASATIMIKKIDCCINMVNLQIEGGMILETFRDRMIHPEVRVMRKGNAYYKAGMFLVQSRYVPLSPPLNAVTNSNCGLVFASPTPNNSIPIINTNSHTEGVDLPENIMDLPILPGKFRWANDVSGIYFIAKYGEGGKDGAMLFLDSLVENINDLGPEWVNVLDSQADKLEAIAKIIKILADAARRKGDE